MNSPSPRYARIPESQRDMLLQLEEKYPGLRFDTGFLGSVPVQAEGRLGARWFYFRFRYDHASLIVGSPDRRAGSGQKKRARRKALRTLRRSTSLDMFDKFLAEQDLKPGRDGLEHYPQYLTRFAGISGVTGERYAGSLEDDEAAALFSELMDSLTDVTKADRPTGFRNLARTRRGRTKPSTSGLHVITK